MVDYLDVVRAWIYSEFCKPISCLNSIWMCDDSDI